MNQHPSNVSEQASNKPASNATAFTLAGTATAPYRAFTAALSNADTCPVHASNGVDWQDFIGTYNAGTLAQTTLLESSTGTWIDWSAGAAVTLEIAWLGAAGENADAHLANTSNPHSVTAAQVGAYTSGAVDTLLSGKSDTSHAHTGVYEPAGTASAAVSAHTGASDPHPQYFGDPAGTQSIGKMIVQSATGPIWVAYATVLNNSVAPAVTGVLTYGNVLTCSTGTWAGYGTISYAYQWYNGATILSGQTASTYTTVYGDVGDAISCTVTATDTLTSASANSNAVTVTDSQLYSSGFYAPLTNSLILTRGTGNPTYTRATASWAFDNEGKLIAVPSGAARFGGARMVRNLVPRSETFLTGWNTNGTATINSATQITLTGSSTNRVSATVDTYSPVTLRYKFKAKGAVGGEQLYVWNLWAGFKVHILTTDYVEYTNTLSDTVSGHAQFLGFYSEVGSITVDITEIQCENVTGQADQTASEYVSVGVLSAPFHGAGVDGVKWFNTNKDGSAISAANLSGYHAEGARTNNLLYSRVLSNATWVKTNVTATTCTGIDNAPNSASTLTAGAANSTILQTLTLASAARSSSAYVKRRTGTGTISFTRDGGTTWTDITSQINGSTWTRVKIGNTSVTNPSVGFKISTSGDAIDVDVVQDEAGAFISSPIITTTAAVTRNADVLTYAYTGNALTNVGSGRAVVTQPVPASGAIFAMEVTGSPFGMSGGNAISFYDGTNYFQKTGLTLSNQNTVGIRWSGLSGALVANGGALTTGTFDGTVGSSSITIGTLANANTPSYGYVKETHIWQTALSDAELQTVTTP